MGYKFTLILNREITDEESAALREAGCAGAIFGSDTLPTNADVPVTKIDFDTTSSPTLAEAIQAGLDAVMKVPDLSVPGLNVPAQPAGPETEEPAPVVEGTVVEGTVVEGTVVEDEPAAPKTRARKSKAKQASAKPAEESYAGSA
jgi:hypothetical protein